MTKAADGGLRHRKKALMRQQLQQHALRLFLSQGYEATTVEMIATAAGVSHMTFFRYFPTKEDVVLADEYDPVLVARLAARPPTEPIWEKLRHAVLEGLAPLPAEAYAVLLQRTRLIFTVPALRARQWDQQHATEALILAALGYPTGERTAWVLVAAGLATLTTALSIWAEQDDVSALPNIINTAFDALLKGRLPYE
ncbi:MAG: TetR family transcriptional regulator [Ktedonobacterales bacterium]|nr:TetR family transcriptional regulator [Ktedonobacterales bacterium]